RDPLNKTPMSRVSGAMASDARLRVASCISSVAATRDLFRSSSARIETATRSGEPLERRRRRPIGSAEALAQREDALEHVLRAQPVGVEERAAAIAREPVAGEPYEVDVGSSGNHAFVDNLRALVDHADEAALDDFGGRNRAP